MNDTLEVRHGCRMFDGHVVFGDACCRFESGRVYALTGPSGSGKTTLLNGIGRLDDLTSGEIVLNGENIEDIGILKYHREVVGYLFQNYALVDEETVMQNLNIVRRHERSVLTEKLVRYGLGEDYLNRRVYTLSGGEAQRVALARLALRNPRIVLADEPTGALDSLNRRLVIDSLREMAEEGRIVIIATHDDEVMNDADECINVAEM